MTNRMSTGFKSRNLVVDLTMVIIFLMLISFTLWLIWLTYFRDYFDTGITENGENEIYKGNISLSGGRFQRFHYISMPAEITSKRSSLCLMCHKDLPHEDSRDTRAFLNAHGSFMTCQVCHIKFDNESQIVYRWLDIESGRYYDNRLNKEAFRIAPAQKEKNGSLKSFDTDVDRQFIMAYLEDENHLGESLREAALERVHENITNEPITCVNCHALEQKPVLPLSELAYSKDRINELSRIEVAGMVMKYTNFYLPSLTRETND